MADQFLDDSRRKSDPARKSGQYIAGVPGGNVVLDDVAKALYVGVQGTLLVQLADDAAGEFSTLTDVFGMVQCSAHTILAGGSAGNIQTFVEK